jgi:ABC-2 type transport system ATP-binding protein
VTAIETEGLTRRFGDLVAVEDLDLEVQSGEVFGFLGPNGAGKSTTINMLLGFLNPSEGTARVLGKDITTDARAVRRRIGLLPEGFSPLENLTGREHVRSAIQTKGADDDPDAILDRVGLEPEAARRAAGDYSKGMTQRLALGIALVGEPDLLILDEPSGGLDPNGVKLLRSLVREEAERGATVFFSSHVLDEVERVCDRVCILHEGQLTAVNTVENLRAQLDTGAVVEATVDPDAVATVDLDPTTVEGVTDISVDEDTVVVQCTGPEAKMPALRYVDDAVTVRDVQVRDASLEALFEEFTNGTDAAAAETAAAGEVATQTTGEEQPAVTGGEQA